MVAWILALKPEWLAITLNVTILARYAWQWQEPGKILYWAGACADRRPAPDERIAQMLITISVWWLLVLFWVSFALGAGLAFHVIAWALSR